MYIVKNEDPNSADASALVDALSDTLAKITGSDGRLSFDPRDIEGQRARFVVARTEAGLPVGCGAFRPMSASVAEVKRMYAVPNTVGVGSAVLAHLESEAAKLGYSELWLETRVVNVRAIAFYERRAYSRIPNFGKYVGRVEAICLGKRLPAIDVLDHR
jgi:GNAT superfamily N-acetyltransferase